MGEKPNCVMGLIEPYAENSPGQHIERLQTCNAKLDLSFDTLPTKLA